MIQRWCSIRVWKFSSEQNAHPYFRDVRIPECELTRSAKNSAIIGWTSASDAKLILYQGWCNILPRSTGSWGWYWFINAHRLQDFKEVFFLHLLQVITLHLQRDFNFSWMFLKLQALRLPKFTAGWFMLLTNQFYENLTWRCGADEYVEVALKMLVTLNCFSIYILLVHVRFVLF